MSKTHYHTSNGETLTKAELDRRIHKAKEQKLENQKNEHGYNFCELSILHVWNPEKDELVNDLEYRILDCSHKISIKEATESGHSELCYDVNNIQIICRKCHKKFDNNQLKFKK
jgi:hypothetical protein